MVAEENRPFERLERDSPKGSLEEEKVQREPPVDENPKDIQEGNDEEILDFSEDEEHPRKKDEGFGGGFIFEERPATPFSSLKDEEAKSKESDKIDPDFPLEYLDIPDTGVPPDHKGNPLAQKPEPYLYYQRLKFF